MSSGFIGASDFGFLPSGGSSSPTIPYLPLTLTQDTDVVQTVYDLEFQSLKPLGPSFLIERLQNQANETDTSDTALEVNYSLENNVNIANFNFIQRAIRVINTNNNRGTLVQNSRTLNLISNTSLNSTTSELDQIYIESATFDGSVTNGRGVVVSNIQGTKRAAFVANTLNGTYNTLALLGTQTIPTSGNWGVYQSSGGYKNHLNGTTLIGTTTDNGLAKLQVSGSINSSSLSGTGTRVVSADANGTLTVAASTAWQYITKPSNTNRTSTTTLTDDPSLLFTIPQGVVCNFRMTVFFEGDPNADFRYQYNITGSTTNAIIRIGAQSLPPAAPGGGVTLTNRAIETTAAQSSYQSVSWTTGASGVVYYNGMIDTTSTAGSVTFAFQWAQNTSTAVAVTVNKGSFIEYRFS